MVFVDGSNLYHALKKLGLPTDIHLGRLAEHLCAGRELVRVHYYNVAFPAQADPQRAAKHQRFLDTIGRTPYVRVCLGRLEPRGNTFAEKGVDVRIVVDMLTHAYRDNYDVAILVSGDGDFAEAAKAVADLGKHVENAFFRSSRSEALDNACDRFVELDRAAVMQCRVGP